MSGQKGYTLIEWLILVFLIGMASLFFLPPLADGVEVVGLRQEATQLIQSMRLAQWEAMRTGVAHAVRLDLGQQPAGVEVRRSDNQQIVERYSFSPVVAEVESNFVGYELLFLPTGTPLYKRGGQVRLTGSISGTMGRNFYYVIVASSGRIRLDRTPPSSKEVF